MKITKILAILIQFLLIQVTTYTHKDENNRFMLKKYNLEPNKGEEIDLIRHGDLIRLEHIATRRLLHSHKELAPISKKHFQVTGYGEVILIYYINIHMYNKFYIYFYFFYFFIRMELEMQMMYGKY